MERTNRKSKILIADDHPLICYALKKMFGETEEFEIIGEARDGEEAVRLALEIKPDIVIIDISMPKMDGMVATQTIKSRCPNILVLVLTVHTDIEHVFGIFEAGADGYLAKSTLGEEIIHSVRKMLAGELILSADAFRNVIKRGCHQPSQPKSPVTCEFLTSREKDILAYLANGKSNKDIATKLNLSEHTIKTYVASVFSKLHAGSRTEAVIIGLRNGIINLADPG